MATYNKVIYDILELLKSNKISDDVDISPLQIDFHLSNQRALWLRNEYNKPGRTIDPQIVQDLKCLELEEVNAADCCGVTVPCIALRTKKQLPQFVELHSGPAITRVGPPNKLRTSFNFGSQEKSIYSMSNKYTYKTVETFILNNYLYILTRDPDYQTMDYVNIQGVLSDPLELRDFKCDSSGDTCFSLEDTYPIANWMLPYVKEQVLNQFGLALQLPKDHSNDAKDDIVK